MYMYTCIHVYTSTRPPPPGTRSRSAGTWDRPRGPCASGRPAAPWSHRPGHSSKGGAVGGGCSGWG